MKNDSDLSEGPSAAATVAENTNNLPGSECRIDISELATTVVRPRPGWHLINLREIWRYRELFAVLAVRDIKVRYRQTIFGILWAIISPVVMMVVFTFIFGKVAKMPTGGIPYPIFFYSGILAWRFFTSALSDSVNSVVAANQMVSKVYFPRLILPFSRVAVSVIDLGFQFLVLFGLMIYYDFIPGWRFFFLPPLVILIAMASLGLGAFFSALNVSFRDVRIMIPFMIQIGLFLTPAIYMDTTAIPGKKATASAAASEVSTEEVAQAAGDTTANPAANPTTKAKNPKGEGVVPDNLQRLLHLNPMMGFISSFRAAVLNRPLPWLQLAYSSAVTVVFFILGCMYFERAQRNFADII